MGGTLFTQRQESVGKRGIRGYIELPHWLSSTDWVNRITILFTHNRNFFSLGSGKTILRNSENIERNTYSGKSQFTNQEFEVVETNPTTSFLFVDGVSDKVSYEFGRSRLWTLKSPWKIIESTNSDTDYERNIKLEYTDKRNHPAPNWHYMDWRHYYSKQFGHGWRMDLLINPKKIWHETFLTKMSLA